MVQPITYKITINYKTTYLDIQPSTVFVDCKYNQNNFDGISSIKGTVIPYPESRTD